MSSVFPSKFGNQDLDNAQFIVKPGVSCDLFMVKRRKFTSSDHKLGVQTIFRATELVIDALTMTFRPRIAINPWNRKLPESILKFGYDCVPHAKMTFALTFEDDKKLDFLVFVFDDRDVQMPLRYGELYREARAGRSV